MERKQLSGAQKRKLAHEKIQKREEALKKIPKISEFFCTNVTEPCSSTQESENVREEPISSEAAVAPSGQYIENENLGSENESGDLSDETIDFDDERERDNFDELFLNVSTSSRYRDIETASEKSSDTAGNRFPTDVALWDLDAELSALQRYWTKFGRFFLRFTVYGAIFYCCRFAIHSFRSSEMSKFRQGISNLTIWAAFFHISFAT